MSRGPMRGRSFAVAAALLLPPLLLLGVALGSAHVPLSDCVGIILHALGLAERSDFPQNHELILLYVRLPRVLLFALVGGALAITGAALQSTFQNPMADSSLLGINGGAALAAVLAVRTGIAESVPLMLPLSAFLGALGAALIVFLLAHAGGRPSTSSLLLTGVAVGSVALAGVTLVMLWTEEYRLKQVLFWTVGGGEGFTWDRLGLAVLPVALGALVLMLRHRALDALSLGDEHALSVGVSVLRERVLLLAASALVAGAAVSVAGTIVFVGLIVPHIVRLLVGPRAKALLPGSFLVGAGFLVACDLVARTVSRQREYPVGILTAVLGVPFLLWLLQRSKRSAA